MHDFEFSVQVEQKTGRVTAAYFRVRKGKVANTKEYADGAAFADYAADGTFLGLELLGPCKVSVLDKIAPSDPDTRAFVESVGPRSLVLT